MPLVAGTSRPHGAFNLTTNISATVLILAQRHNKRFDPSEWSLILIENLAVPQILPAGSTAALGASATFSFWFTSRTLKKRNKFCVCFGASRHLGDRIEVRRMR